MTTVLLIQLFEESPLGVSALEAELSQQFGSQLIAIDSFSDSSNLGYIKKMIDHSEKVVAVIWEVSGSSLKGLQPLLNSLLKKRHSATLLTNSDHPLVVKLSKALEAQRVESAQELLEGLNQ